MQRRQTYVNTAATVSTAAWASVLDACSDALAILGVGNFDLFAAVFASVVLVVVNSDDVVRVFGVFATVSGITILFWKQSG